MRMPADRRRLQAEGRDQPAAAATPEERKRGVVAFSSGNHARGVAIAARRLGIRAAIVMPADAPQVKIDGTRGEGAEIVFYDRRRESREAIAAQISEETGAAVVPSFDDPAIVAGQGTVGLEIVEQLGEPPRASSFRAAAAGLRRALRWPCPKPRSSSSSRKAGTTWRARSSAARSCRSPRMRPIPSATRSRRRGCRRSRSGSCASAEPGAVGQRCRGADAVRFAWERHELVVEPGGAVGARGAARGQGRAAGGYGGGAVGRKCRSGASRADRRERLKRRCGSCIRRARGGAGSSARPPWSAPRARRRGS